MDPIGKLYDSSFFANGKLGSVTLKKAYLLAFIDGHSRFIVHAGFYPSETFETLKVALHEAVARRGIPKKCYVDNGSCYRSDGLKRILACLGTALSHSRPYKPASTEACKDSE